MSCIDGHEYYAKDGSVQIGEHLVSVLYVCYECGETLEDEAEV